MSKARAKGTTWETELLPHLREAFGPQVDRAPLRGIHDYGDFTGCPILVEAKNHLKPSFQEWARKCEAKAGSDWIILWHGDRRATTGAGPYGLVPMDLLLRLLAKESA